MGNTTNDPLSMPVVKLAKILRIGFGWDRFVFAAELMKLVSSAGSRPAITRSSGSSGRCEASLWTRLRKLREKGGSVCFVETT